MSPFTLEVDPWGGTDIRDALTEAKTLARKLDLAYVKFNFNNVSISIGQGCDINDTVLEYKQFKGNSIIRP